jgi:DNA-3-methyladenine glycosylase
VAPGPPTNTPTLALSAMALRPLPPAFFDRPTIAVARALLGQLLVHETRSGVLVGRIVEVEAYRGPLDPASHAHRRTARSEIMYGRPGLAYVYLSYGVHHCLNVVTERNGRAGAVLVRAIEPVSGLTEMLRRAPTGTPPRVGSGPGRLTRALGIGLAHNAADLGTPPLYLADGGAHRLRIVTGPRVGITRAVDRRWRFGIARHPALSRPFPTGL